MNLLSSEEAKKLLHEEYPIFQNEKISITKQFKTAKGRVFNTFLVESTKQGFERFIAKGIVHEKYGLELEWKILATLQEKEADAPKILLSDHKPQHFLLLEFIEGLNAAEAIDRQENIEKVFYEVGTATGKLHSILSENYGDLLNPQNISWKKYLENKVTERLEGVKHLIPEELFENTQQFFHSIRPIIEVEALEKPRLIHRDIYLENFILKKETDHAILIDYGMVIGGRPFYDLGKFYILELYKRPSQRDVFLEAYGNYVPLPKDFNERMKLYILKEALGMVNFFHSIKDEEAKRHAITILEELTKNKGVIPDLLN